MESAKSQPDSPLKGNAHKPKDPAPIHLTPRENEILVMVREGMSDKEIACKLFISVYTQKAHIRNIHKKLRVKTRAELIAKLNKTGF